MDSALVSRLVKTLAMLDSPMDGERHAAVAATARVLKSAGMTWGDFARELEHGGPCAPRRRQRDTAGELQQERRRRREAEKMAEQARKEADQHANTAKRQQQHLSTVRRELASERERVADLERQVAVLSAWAQHNRSPHAWRDEVGRLLHEGKLSLRAIARQVGVSPQTVANIRDRRK